MCYEFLLHSRQLCSVYIPTVKIVSCISVVKLNVHKAPVIVRRPVKEVVVPLDGMTTLECNATGNPRPVLLWMRERDRTVLLPGDR